MVCPELDDLDVCANQERIAGSGFTAFVCEGPSLLLDSCRISCWISFVILDSPSFESDAIKLLSRAFLADGKREGRTPGIAVVSIVALVGRADFLRVGVCPAGTCWTAGCAVAGLISQAVSTLPARSGEADIVVLSTQTWFARSVENAGFSVDSIALDKDPRICNQFLESSKLESLVKLLFVRIRGR